MSYVCVHACLSSFVPTKKKGTGVLFVCARVCKFLMCRQLCRILMGEHVLLHVRVFAVYTHGQHAYLLYARTDNTRICCIYVGSLGGSTTISKVAQRKTKKHRPAAQREPCPCQTAPPQSI